MRERMTKTKKITKSKSISHEIIEVLDESMRNSNNLIDEGFIKIKSEEIDKEEDNFLRVRAAAIRPHIYEEDIKVKEADIDNDSNIYKESDNIIEEDNQNEINHGDYFSNDKLMLIDEIEKENKEDNVDERISEKDDEIRSEKTVEQPSAEEENEINNKEDEKNDSYHDFSIEDPQENEPEHEEGKEFEEEHDEETPENQEEELKSELFDRELLEKIINDKSKTYRDDSIILKENLVNTSQKTSQIMNITIDKVSQTDDDDILRVKAANQTSETTPNQKTKSSDTRVPFFTRPSIPRAIKRNSHKIRDLQPENVLSD